MVTIVEVSAPADAFPLGAVFETLPGATVELERIVPTGDTILPYFWVLHGDGETVLDHLEARPEISNVAVLDEVDGNVLFRADWNCNVEGVVTAIADAGLTLLSAIGTSERWLFELRTDDLRRIDDFRQCARANGIDVNVVRIRSLERDPPGGGYDLTPEQREALLLAYEQGYYDRPRESNLEDLADALGISRPAFADRLRRGYANLVRTTLVRGA